MWSIEWRHFQLPWTTANRNFIVAPLFDIEYLRNVVAIQNISNVQIEAGSANVVGVSDSMMPRM